MTRFWTAGQGWVKYSRKVFQIKNTEKKKLLKKFFK